MQCEEIADFDIVEGERFSSIDLLNQKITTYEHAAGVKLRRRSSTPMEKRNVKDMPKHFAFYEIYYECNKKPKTGCPAEFCVRVNKKMGAWAFEVRKAMMTHGSHQTVSIC